MQEAGDNLNLSQQLELSIIYVCYTLVSSTALVVQYAKKKEQGLLTDGHFKPGQHFRVTFLTYNGTQENGCDVILNLIKNAIDLPNIMAVIRDERSFSNNTRTLARLKARQIVKIFAERSRDKPNLRG